MPAAANIGPAEFHGLEDHSADLLFDVIASVESAEVTHLPHEHVVDELCAQDLNASEILRGLAKKLGRDESAIRDALSSWL